MIKVNNLSKYYGDYPAVINISFELKKGDIVGLLGPNGAGKTTTMRVLTGFTPPTEGDVTIGGFDIIKNSLEIRKLIGYLPESVPLYQDMEVTDYLEFMGKIRGMSNSKIKKRLPEVIEIIGLGEYRNVLVGKLSKGYRQRTGIAQAILHEPKILILDEPTIGIDPVQVIETRGLIKELGGNHTLILSSHILPEVSMICKRVLVIHEGKIVADDKPSVLSEKLKTSEQIELSIKAKNINEILKELRNLNFIVDARQSLTNQETSTSDENINLIVEVKPENNAQEIIAKTIIEKGWGLIRLNSIPMTLEEIFMHVTTDEKQKK